MAGAPVIVPRLGRAEVVSLLPDDKVEVRVGAMRAMVPIADVLMDPHRAARRAAGTEPPEQGERDDRGDRRNRGDRGHRGDRRDRDDGGLGGPGGAGGPVTLVDGVPAGGRATARTLDTTVDVRGNRVDEAVTQVDRFLDESLLAGRDAIFVIHGHGTGALRNAVRSHLQGHQAVDKFRPGEQSEGGDGVTVAFLKG